MKRPRIRIGTLMLLVVIVAMAVALIDDRARIADLQVKVQELCLRAAIADELEQQALIESARATGEHIKDLNALKFGLEPVAFSASVERIADEDLHTTEDDVIHDLDAIAEGFNWPIDFTDASAPYVVYRRDKKQSRAEAVEAVRADLKLKAAAEKIGKAGAK